MTEHNKVLGSNAESHFTFLCNQAGLNYHYADDYYDFDVENVKVEVKSAMLSVRTAKGYASGRWDFTDGDSRRRLISEDVWICLILRVRGEHVMIGMVRGSQLEDKRYIPVSQYRKYTPVFFEDWVKQVKNETK